MSEKECLLVKFHKEGTVKQKGKKRDQLMLLYCPLCRSMSPSDDWVTANALSKNYS
jgi:hypothetical protein